MKNISSKLILFLTLLFVGGFAVDVQAIVGNTCVDNAECDSGSGEVCDLGASLCALDAGRCAIDGDCPSGDLCLDTYCKLSACRIDGDCATSQMCIGFDATDGGGVCTNLTTGQCITNSDCTSGKVCEGYSPNVSAGICEDLQITGCYEDVDCTGVGEVCTGADIVNNVAGLCEVPGGSGVSSGSDGESGSGVSAGSVGCINSTMCASGAICSGFNDQGDADPANDVRGVCVENTIDTGTPPPALSDFTTVNCVDLIDELSAGGAGRRSYIGQCLANSSIDAKYDILADTMKSVCYLDELAQQSTSGAVSNAERKGHLIRRLELAKAALDISCLKESINIATTKSAMESAFDLYKNIRNNLVEILSGSAYDSAQKTAIKNKLGDAAGSFNKTIAIINCENIPVAEPLAPPTLSDPVAALPPLLNTATTDPTDVLNPRTYSGDVTFDYIPLTTTSITTQFDNEFDAVEEELVFENNPSVHFDDINAPSEPCEFSCPITSSYSSGKCIPNVCAQGSEIDTTPSNSTTMTTGSPLFTRGDSTNNVWKKVDVSYSPVTSFTTPARRYDVNLVTNSSNGIYYIKGNGQYSADMPEVDCDSLSGTAKTNCFANTLYDQDPVGSTVVGTPPTSAVQTLIQPDITGNGVQSGIQFYRFNPGVSITLKDVQNVPNVIFKAIASGTGALRIVPPPMVSDEAVSFWFRPDNTYEPITSTTHGLLWNYHGWTRRIVVAYEPKGTCFADKVGFNIRFVIGTYGVKSTDKNFATATSPCYPVTNDFHMIAYSADRVNNSSGGEVTFTFYVDGKPLATNYNKISATGALTNNTVVSPLFPNFPGVANDQFHIGKSVGSTPTQHEFGKGDIAEVKFYSTSYTGNPIPTPDEIKSQYNTHILSTVPYRADLNSCQFTCAYGYTWDLGSKSCVPSSRELSCGTVPLNGVPHTPSSKQTYSATLTSGVWTRASTNSEDKTTWTSVAYPYTAPVNECRFSCAVGYRPSGGGCARNSFNNPTMLVPAISSTAKPIIDYKITNDTSIPYEQRYASATFTKFCQSKGTSATLNPGYITMTRDTGAGYTGSNYNQDNYYVYSGGWKTATQMNGTDFMYTVANVWCK